MKNIFFAALLTFGLATGCRNNEDAFQEIDQVVAIYIDSAGKDMLNPKNLFAYTSVAFNDANGIRVEAPVSFSTYYDQDSIVYIEYVAGAKRVLIDSTSEYKKYESKIEVHLTTKNNGDTESKFTDTLVLQYLETPQIFRINQAFYNNKVVFVKVDDAHNTIRISK